MVNLAAIPNEFREALFIEDASITIQPQQAFQKIVSQYPEQAIRDIYHNILRQYVIFKLSDRCSKAHEARTLGKETLNNVEELKRESQLFDQLEAEFETETEFQEETLVATVGMVISKNLS